MNFGPRTEMARAVPRVHSLWQRGLVVGIVVGVAVGGFGLVYPGVHAHCSIGTAVAEVSLASPLAVVNSPYDGASSFNFSGAGPQYSFSSGSLSETTDPWVPVPGVNYGGIPRNGSDPWGLDMTLNWTIYSVKNVTGISAAGPCSQPYIAEANLIRPNFSYSNYAVQEFELSLPNNTTDQGEPNSIPGVPSVLIFNSLNPDTENLTGSWESATYYPYAGHFSDCAAPPHSWTFYASGTPRVPIAIPFTLHGRQAETTGFLTWSGFGSDPAAAYTMPAFDGIWWFVAVGAPFPQAPPPMFPPAGLNSFSYQPCPSWLDET